VIFGIEVKNYLKKERKFMGKIQLKINISKIGVKKEKEKDIL
jgi:hypothetical protein